MPPPAGFPIRPHAAAIAADRYCRLFQEASVEAQGKMTAKALGDLADLMRQSKRPQPTDRPGHLPSAAAVTYFGQFVDHDLTMDTTPLREAESSEPIYTINHRTPWLDLDHLYGEGPCSNRHHHLYESDDASFRLGHCPDGGEPFDVPFTHEGHPALADERNGENIILRQIHAMFLKLHNAAVREQPKSMSARERFERARDRVRWQYQWLVREWYLLEICHQDAWVAVFESEDRRIDWSQDGFAIPVEFSAAVMRFGHSMVRNRYTFVPGEKPESFPLGRLFGMRNNRPLPRNLKINWEFFGGEDFAASANPIDTTIADSLFELPDQHIDLYVRTPVPHPPPILALRTLMRGAAMRLPTAQQALRHLGVDVFQTPQGVDPWATLKTVGLEEHTPLWYYILLEAEFTPGISQGVEMKRKYGGFGATLGQLGSRLIAEIVHASLENDPTSFVRQKEKGWKPEPWKAPGGGEEIDLSKLLKDYKPILPGVAKIADVSP